MGQIFASDSGVNAHGLEGKTAICSAYCDSDRKSGRKQAARITTL
jgi:hypothetical protein